MKKALLLTTLASMTLVANAYNDPYQMNYADWGALMLNGNQLSSSKTGGAVQLKGWSTYSLHREGVQGKESILETAELDMYCIVDWHILPESLSNGDPNEYINEAKDFFGEISKYCADNGYDHVLYEICNEPTCGWMNVKSYAEDVIPVITDNQPEAIIIVGIDQWSQKIMEPVSNPIDTAYKKNVMYSFHYYACSHYHLLLVVAMM